MDGLVTHRGQERGGVVGDGGADGAPAHDANVDGVVAGGGKRCWHGGHS